MVQGLALAWVGAIDTQSRQQTGVFDPQQLGIRVKGGRWWSTQGPAPLRTDAQANRDMASVQVTAVPERAGGAMGV